MSKQPCKPLEWVGSAKRDLDAMTARVKDVFGHVIDLAQPSGKHQDVKVRPASVRPACRRWLENSRGDTRRAGYSVKFAGWVYILHCLQKKSNSGIKTAQVDMHLIHARLKAAKQDFAAWQTKQGTR